MCRRCCANRDDHIPARKCRHCGEDSDVCAATCNDDTVCRTCWDFEYTKVQPWDFDTNIEGCNEDDCRCECHHEQPYPIGNTVLNWIFRKNRRERSRQELVKDQPFNLMGLPKEVRRRIYGFAFLQHYSTTGGRDRRAKYHQGAISLDLMLTNKQIHAECWEDSYLPLTVNTLDFSIPRNVITFKRHRNFGNLFPHIRSVELTYRISNSIKSLIKAIQTVAPLDLQYFGLTVKGRLLDSTWLRHRKGLTNALSSVNASACKLTVGSMQITDAEKRGMQRDFESLCLKDDAENEAA